MLFVKDIKQDPENSYRGKVMAKKNLLLALSISSGRNYNNVSKYLKKEINFWPELDKIV